MVFNEQDDLRVVMRQWATGVTIVTARYRSSYYGMTVNSFTSISLDPRVISISLMKESRTHDFVLKAKAFGVSILSNEQQEISKIFSGKVSESEDRFDGLDAFTLKTGAPLLSGSLGYLDCKLTETHNFGTNSLLIGEVLTARSGKSGEPLLYFNQRYHQLQE
jgi:flavin reductase (DIM6/NTAB) family NADH-FMN oxidoreductase RutF